MVFFRPIIPNSPPGAHRRASVPGLGGEKNITGRKKTKEEEIVEAMLIKQDQRLYEITGIVS